MSSDDSGIPLRECAAAEDEVPMIALALSEDPMPTPEPVTRTTVYAHEVVKLCRVLGLPVETDPSKAVRAAADALRDRREADARAAVLQWLVQQQSALREDRA